MFFVMGTALASASFFLLGLCYIGVRNQKDSFWTGDFMVGSIYVPGIIMIISFSLGAFYHVIRDYSTRPLTGVTLGGGVAIAVVSILAWRLSSLGKKIKAYRQAETATIIVVDFNTEELTTPPASGGKPARRKAA